MIQKTGENQGKRTLVRNRNIRVRNDGDSTLYIYRAWISRGYP